MFTCTLKEGENPDGVTTGDGSQTACPDVTPNLDGVTARSENPCELYAAEQRAAAEAAIGLAIIVAYYRNTGTVHVEDIDSLKG